MKLLHILLFIPYISFSQSKVAPTNFCETKINTKVEVPCNQEVEQTSQGDLIQLYTLNDSFPINDVRRYGVFPNKEIGTHPVTASSKIQVVLDLAEAGINLHFPSGYYETGLLIDSRSNINLYFDDAVFAGVIHITNDNGCSSKNIYLKGKISTFDRFGIYHSENIELDTLICKNDPAKNYYKTEGRGCHIYVGTKNLRMKYLEIEGMGSGKGGANNHAALSIDGWKNNPQGVVINKVLIKSSDRHGIYITGFDHKIDEIEILNYGMGNSQNMSLMQDAKRGEEKEFTGLWINRCYNTFLGEISIHEETSNGSYSIFFDEGDTECPVVIKKLTVTGSTIKTKIEKKNGVVLDYNQLLPQAP